MNNRVLLINEPRPFFSYLDEKHFFSWLESIVSVQNIKPVDGGMELTLDYEFEKESLYDLISLMMRYGLDMQCLKELCTEKNKSWFKNPNAYWYKKVFGS